MTAEEKKAQADALMAAAKAEAEAKANVEGGDATANEETKVVKINGFEYKKENVNRCKAHIKGLKYKITDDSDAANVFIYQTKETVWGTVRDEDTEDTTFVKTARSFPASDWGVIPTLRQDMLLRNVVDDMIILSLTDGAQFEKNYGHIFDDVELSLLQIYVPAHTDFVNPYTTAAVPKPKSYEKDYVFTFIEGFKYNPKNINHKQFLKDIYDGCPREVDGETKPTTKRFSICPEDYVDSLADMGYFGQVDNATLEKMYKSMSYGR